MSKCEDPDCIGCVLGGAFERLVNRYPEELIIRATFEILSEIMADRGHSLQVDMVTDGVPDPKELH